MNKEEFEKLEDKWQTVYIEGRTPIQMVSKNSSKKDCILWYDEDECSHTIHYSKITLELSDFEQELEKLTKNYLARQCDYHEGLTMHEQSLIRNAFKAGYIKRMEE